MQVNKIENKMDKEEMKKLLQENIIKFKEEIKSMFKAEFQKLTMEVVEIKNSIQFLSDKYDEIILENSALKEQVNLLKNTSMDQSLSIKKLEDDRRQFNKRLNMLDNSNRYNKLELHGIKHTTGENTDRIAFNVLKMADSSLDKSNIADSYRVMKWDKITKASKNGPIVVKFKNAEKRDDCYFNRKKLAGINFKEIGIDAERVYINENLCPETRKLFFEANSIKKKKGYKRIWTQGGLIKLRKDFDTQVITIYDDNDLKIIN